MIFVLEDGTISIRRKKYFQENGVMVFYNDFSDTLFAEIPAACRGEVHWQSVVVQVILTVIVMVTVVIK